MGPLDPGTPVSGVSRTACQSPQVRSGAGAETSAADAVGDAVGEALGDGPGPPMFCWGLPKR